MQILHSEAVQQSLADRLEAERRKMGREVDAELEAERAEAEAEKRRAQEAIQAKQQELEQLENMRAREVWTSASFLAELFVMSPWKLFSFIILKKRIYGIKVSKNKLI